MGYFKRIFLVVLIFSLFPTGRLATAAEDAPVREILENGMTVILQENHRAPVVTMQAWVKAGAITEQEFSGSGISHFVEHMLFKGTDRRGVGQIGLEVKEAGGRTNAYTGSDRTVYYVTFHSDHFDNVLDIMADVLMRSKLDPDEIERERNVILKEIKMNRDDPFRRLYHMANKTAYAVHPYRNPVIGYESLFRKLTRDDLLTYYKRFYVPNNIIFVTVGNFDADEALPKIRAAFRDFERGSLSPAVVPEEPPQRSPRRRAEKFRVAVAQSMMGFHGPGFYSEDMYAMDVLAIILGGGDTSRLYRELREKGLVYDIRAWSATPRDPGMFWIFSTFEPENRDVVEQEVWKQIERLKSEEIPSEELDTARAKALSAYIFSRESVEGQARSLASGEFDAHDINFDEQYVESIKDVTPRDIQHAVRKYFASENFVMATLLPETAQRREGPLVTEQTASTSEIEKFVLPNGLTVLLRSDPETETAAVRLFLMGGSRAESKANAGITNLMSKSMLKGTDSRTAEEIALAIESRGGKIRSFAGHNSLGFELDMLSRDLETGLAVLGDVVVNPSFPGKEVDREKAAVIAEIKSVDDKIFPSAVQLLRETMFPNHPYGCMAEGKTEVVQALSTHDLAEFHSQNVVASRAVLAIFGDIDKSAARSLAQRYFGNLKRGKELETANSSGPFREKTASAHKEMDKEQLAVLIGFPGIAVNDPDRYPLEVLTNLLNSQGGMLFQRLRDERGLAYSVGAFNILGVDPGALVFYIITVPQNREEAINGLLEVASRLRASLPDAQELRRTKTEAMGKHAIAMQTNGQLATEAAFDQLYGLGYNNYTRYDENIRAVTAEDIQRLASGILDLERYVLVTVGNQKSEESQ